MKKLLLRPLLWALLLWFSGGTAYLEWTFPAWFPSQGRKDGIEYYVISAEADRIIAAPAIIIPLILFCALPVACVALPLKGIASVTLELFGYPAQCGQHYIPAISSLLVSFVVYLLIIQNRHQTSQTKENAN